MSINITIGWWLLPAVLTVVCWVWGQRMEGPRTGGLGDMMHGLATLLAMIPALLGWIVYFIIREIAR